MIVVDSSAIVGALLGDVGAEDVVRRMSGQKLHAPELIDVEVLSVLRRAVRQKLLSRPRALDLLADYSDLAIRRWSCTRELRLRMFELRDSFSAYDANYVALAEALGCPLITRDAGIARSRGHSASVELV